MTCISPLSCPFLSEQQNQWQRGLGRCLFDSLETDWKTFCVNWRASHTWPSCYFKPLTCGPSVSAQMSLLPSFTGTLITMVRFSSLILFVTLKMGEKPFQELEKCVLASGLSKLLIIVSVLWYIAYLHWLQNCLLHIIITKGEIVVAEGAR